MQRLHHILVFVCCLLAFSSALSFDTSNDPNHPGWKRDEQGRLVPVVWRGLRTDGKCKACDPWVKRYDDVMRTLFEVRFEIESSDQRSTDHAEAVRQVVEKRDTLNTTNRAKGLGFILEFDSANKKYTRNLKDMMPALEAEAAQLRRQLEICGKQCKKGLDPEVKKAIRVDSGGMDGKPKAYPQPQEWKLPIPWEGPYREDCWTCTKVGKQLNELPDKLRLRQLEITALKREIDIYKATNDLMDKAFGGYMPRRVFSIIEVDGALKRIERLEWEIEEIKKNFKKSLDRYNKCTNPKHCEKVGAAPVLAEDLTVAVSGVWDLQVIGSVRTSHLTVSLNREHLGNGQRDKDGPWVGSLATKGTETGVYRFGPLHTLNVGEDGTIIFAHGQFGYCNCKQETVQVRVVETSGSLEGNWSFEGKEGKVIWRKRPPSRIHSITIERARFDHDSASVSDTYRFEEDVGRIERKHPVTCHFGGMRVNCDRVNLRIVGDGFAGGNDIEVYDEKFEISGVGWLCSNNTVAKDTWFQCPMKEKPGDQVVGLFVTVLLRDGIVPGTKTLQINDQLVPIELDIDGYPSAETRAGQSNFEIYFVRAGIEGKEPISGALPMGVPLAAELRYEAPPSDPEKSVELESGIDLPGKTNLPVQPVDGSTTVFRSAPFVLVAPEI